MHSKSSHRTNMDEQRGKRSSLIDKEIMILILTGAPMKVMVKA